jgi:hypothetical protein
MGSRSADVGCRSAFRHCRMRFVPKFSRSVTSSKRSFHESETILTQPDSNSPDKAQAASITVAFVEEGQ